MNTWILKLIIVIFNYISNDIAVMDTNQSKVYLLIHNFGKILKLLILTISKNWLKEMEESILRGFGSTYHAI